MSAGRARAGAALVIAIVILAGLLLLGLPFLFSQSASLAGSRSLAYHQSAAIGQGTAEQVAVAYGAYSVRDHYLADGGIAFSTLDPVSPPVRIERIQDNRYALGLGTGPNDLQLDVDARNAVLHSAAVADESGKLDVNHLDVAAWDRLLQAVGIRDWDDDAVWDSEDLNGNRLYDTADPNKNRAPVSTPAEAAQAHGDDDDGDSFGELAEALAEYRLQLKNLRITHLEQLLDADPRHNQQETAPTGDYTTSRGAAGNSYGFRRKLTRAELELLRPYLTVHTLGQGRGRAMPDGTRITGLVDLGSVVLYEPPDPASGATIGTSWFDSDVGALVKPGSTLAWPTTDVDRPVHFGVATGTGNRVSIVTGRYPTPDGSVPDRAFALSVPPPVNLHNASERVRLAIGGPEAFSPVRETLSALWANAGSGAAGWRFLSPTATGRELPPVAIASQGVIQIDAIATANDPQARPAAQRMRRTIAQAVPQERPLERRWLTQADWEALIAARHTSRMESWPKPIRRVDDQNPDEAQTSTEDDPVGVRPATEPSLATGFLARANTTPAARKPSHLQLDWRLPLGAGERTAAAEVFKEAETGGTMPPDQTWATAPATSDLRPDGLRVAAGTDLLLHREPAPPTAGGAPPAPAHGPLRAVSASRHDLRGRHLSFWFKPGTDWNWTQEKILPLLDLRMPAAHAAGRADRDSTGNPVPGSNELQNRFGVFYDREAQALVLVLAPPTVEHLVDHGPAMWPDDTLTTFDLDERSLGATPAGLLSPAPTLPPGGLLPLAPALPYPGSGGAPAAIWDEDNALYTARATRLLKPNRVVQIYKVVDPGPNEPFFRRDRWYHLQVVLGGDQIGASTIVLDGHVGRDVLRQPGTTAPPSNIAQLRTGDRLTLPALPLVTHITPFVANTAMNAASQLVVPQIVVQPVLGLRAQDLFPARGMLRIDDEYFTYDRVTDNTFHNCQRAQRQNTQVDHPSNAQFRWPNIQEHLPGALVVPGGYRLALDGNGHLYRGGCTLAADLAHGDPSLTGPHPYLIWGRIRRTSDGAAIVDDTTNPNIKHWMSSAGYLPFQSSGGTNGDPTQFPRIGIVRIQNHMFGYSNPVGVTDRLLNLVSLDGADARPAGGAYGPLPADVQFNGTNENADQEVVLIGVPLQGENPFDTGRYDLDDKPSVDDGFFLQLVDRQTGRIEWIAYQQILRHPALLAADPAGVATGFIVNRRGFQPDRLVGGTWVEGTRGQQRTDCVGRQPSSRLLPATPPFAAGSPVIPVQTELGGHGHWIATGDVITFLPEAFGVTGNPQPFQAVVRYSTCDGYTSGSATATANDTKNEYFAFLDPLPDGIFDLTATDPTGAPVTGIPAGNFEALMWPCWSGEDLTPMNPVAEPRGQMPRLDLFTSDPASATATARLRLGGAHAEPANLIGASTAQQGAYDAVRLDAASMTIDALVAGDLDGFIDSADREGLGIVRGLAGSTETVAPAAALLGVVQASRPGFFRFDHGTQYGLVLIDGEVFAYRQLSRAEATAIHSATVAVRALYPGEPNPSPDDIRTTGRYAKLVGAGLLDGDPALNLAHALPTTGPLLSDGRPARGLLTARVLPIGPVASLGTAAQDQQWFRIHTGYEMDGNSPSQERPQFHRLDAPYAYVCASDGTPASASVIGLAGPRTFPNPPRGTTVYEYVTAPWLRGLYQTPNDPALTPQDAIVIGFWPRYPSALPPETEVTEPHLRSRAFAWIGLPFALHGARFDASLMPGLPVAEVTSLPSGAIGALPETTLAVRARAAAEAFTWLASTAVPLPIAGFGSAPAPYDLATAFGAAFAQPVEGAELRLNWHYDGARVRSAALPDMADAANRAPAFGPSRLRAVAPALVLAVEDAR